MGDASQLSAQVRQARMPKPGTLAGSEAWCAGHLVSRETALVGGPDLVAWSDVLPVADVDPVVARQLELPNSPTETNRAVWLGRAARRHGPSPLAVCWHSQEGELTVPDELEIADRVVGRSEIVVCGPLDDAAVIAEQLRWLLSMTT